MSNIIDGSHGFRKLINGVSLVDSSAMNIGLPDMIQRESSEKSEVLFVQCQKMEMFDKFLFDR